MKNPGKDSCQPDECALPLSSDSQNSHLQFIPLLGGGGESLTRRRPMTEMRHQP